MKGRQYLWLCAIFFLLSSHSSAAGQERDTPLTAAEADSRDL